MLITLPTYHRIYSVACHFLTQKGQSTQQACLFYSYCGAHILKQHYGHDAKVNCGIACYHLGIEPLLCFGEYADGQMVATKNAFHAWVEVGGWLIDFMAPEFPDVMKGNGVTFFIPSKMWQMELNKASSDIDSMKNAGDFFLFRDNQLINTITQKLDVDSFMKLLDECSSLYGTKNTKTSDFDKALDGYW